MILRLTKNRYHSDYTTNHGSLQGAGELQNTNNKSGKRINSRPNPNDRQRGGIYKRKQLPTGKRRESKRLVSRRRRIGRKVNVNPSAGGRISKRKKAGKFLVLPFLNLEKRAEKVCINRKGKKTGKTKKGIDKKGRSEYNSQCCREGRGGEPRGERARY